MLADLDMLPSFVGIMHSKFNSPVVAIGIIMSITSFFAFFFNWYLVARLQCSVAVDCEWLQVLCQRRRQRFRQRRVCCVCALVADSVLDACCVFVVAVQGDCPCPTRLNPL
jgi:hypothetical protein